VVDTRCEANREVSRAGVEFKDTARGRPKQRLHDCEGLGRIRRPVLARGRDLLVTKLCRVLGSEMLWFGRMRLSHDLYHVTPAFQRRQFMTHRTPSAANSG